MENLLNRCDFCENKGETFCTSLQVQVPCDPRLAYEAGQQFARDIFNRYVLGEVYNLDRKNNKMVTIFDTRRMKSQENTMWSLTEQKYVGDIIEGPHSDSTVF